MKHQALPLNSGAFTLIELLCVITIIGLLASLLMPVTGRIIERANDTKCMNNLRQIGIAANAAATDNDNKYPIIEIDDDGKIVDAAFETDALPLDQALAKYGVTSETLQCPADLKGPNNYESRNPHSSYMWQPFSEDVDSAVPSVLRRRGVTTIPSSKLRLATDWSAVHAGDKPGGRKMMYAVYGDGHVQTSYGQRK